MQPCSPANSLTRSRPTPTAQSARLAGFCTFTVFDADVLNLVGVHRVQRVPVTEKNGRRHSSNITVTAAGAAPPVTPAIDRADVRVDTYRATGPGGQHRNKTSSAVRLTHLPTGIVVTAEEDRSQHRNRAVAWQRMERALDDRHTARVSAKQNQQRAAAFDQARSFTWTAWRDQVKTSDGRTCSMRRALAGDLRALIG